MSLLIKNASVVTPDAILPNHAIYINNTVIEAIGKSSALESEYASADTVIDANGQLAMPGNICAHTHFYGAYARGMAIPGAAPANFPQILERLWWALDKTLDEKSVRASALVCLVDAIKHGTTSLIDHHASPNFINGSLDVIAETLETAGLRGVLCYEVTDRDGAEKMQAGIDENVRFIETSRDNPRIRGAFGLHAGLTLSDDTLRACVEALPEGSGFHVHVAEHESDEEDSLKRSGKRVVQRLNDCGIWNDKSIAAHCVHIDDEERAILREHGVWVTHQPRSNMNNAVGAANIQAFLDDGFALCLGNDGFSNNMWAEWKTAYLLHKVVHRDPRMANGADIATMAMQNNARLLENFFPEKSIGDLKVGAQGDVILVDYKPFTPLSIGNLPWHIIFGFESSMVTTTIVDGQVLMQNRKLLTLDEDAIVAEAMALAPDVWQRYTEIAEAL